MRDLGSALSLSIPSLARALDRSPDCVKLLDMDGRLVWMNQNGLCAMEIDSFADFEGRKWPELWPEPEAGRVGASMIEAAKEGIATFSGLCPTAKGTQRWWDVTVHPAEDEHGRIVGFLSISRDVTDRENQRAALEAVVAEMRHRLRNSYTIVIGLIRALSRGRADLAGFSSELQHRITAISEAQSLFVTGNHETGLAELVTILTEPFRGQDGVALEVEVDRSVVIDARVSDAIALSVGEFVVNSAKHGALAKGGEIGVRGWVDGGALTLVWQERAVEPVLATARDGGQGLAIITTMLRANAATLDLSWGTHGPVATICFRQGFRGGAATRA